MSATFSTTADDSLVGCVLGNYRITNVLNVGGMGSVYRAQHELLDRPAAIKLLRPELTENDELVQRFFNEARAATAIRHPGIVEVYDFGYTDEGLAFLVMELLDGQPLSNIITERGRFPEIEVAQIARNIASALKAAHAKGIIHRDLKPDNVFLVPDPDGREARVKVLDFGIAKLANPSPDNRRRTQTGVLMGTPKYMAPEQAREAAAIDARADLYSLGCIVYELLVGEPPFIADGAGEIIAMQLFTEPEPPSKRIDISEEMEQLVMSLLAKHPGDRPQTASEVMDRLVAIGARMSGIGEVMSVDSRNNIRVSAASRALMDTLPSTPSAELLVLVATPAPAKRSKAPFLILGLALLIAGGTVAFFATRTAPEPEAPAPAPPVVAPVVAPTPPPSPPQQIVTPPTPPAQQTSSAAAVVETKPVVVKKKPVVKTGDKIDKPPVVETKQVETKPAETKLTTPNNSPLETDVGDFRKPKAP